MKPATVTRSAGVARWARLASSSLVTVLPAACGSGSPADTAAPLGSGSPGSATGTETGSALASTRSGTVSSASRLSCEISGETGDGPVSTEALSEGSHINPGKA
jgi:hypothetical protein